MQPLRDPSYNFYQIRQCIKEVQVDAKGWETCFNQRGINPLRIIYEDFVVDQEATLRCIFEFLEIEIPEDFKMPASELKRQANLRSGLWAEKFNRGDRE